MPHPLELVLLPGMDGTGMLFQPLLDVLPASVVPHVQRYPLHELLPMEALAAEVQQALPRGSDFVLVAESFSGPIALRIAASQPPGLRAVILCASFAAAPVRLPAWMAPVIRPGLLQAAPFALQSLMMLGPDAPAPLRSLLATALSTVSTEVLAQRARELLRVDATDALSTLRVPLLHLRATRDGLVSSRSGDHLRRHQPQATFVDIDGPHLLLQARPEACWRAIEAFLCRGV